MNEIKCIGGTVENKIVSIQTIIYRLDDDVTWFFCVVLHRYRLYSFWWNLRKKKSLTLLLDCNIFIGLIKKVR